MLTTIIIIVLAVIGAGFLSIWLLRLLAALIIMSFWK